MKILQLIFYRFIRLTPVYLVVIVFTELSLKHVYNESVFAPGLSDHLTCENYWWRNIFYINNFYPLTETCLMWSWYLANDFQFYIVSVVLLIFTSRRLKITIFVKTFLLVIALIISMFISVRHKYQHKVAEPFESFDFLYNKPWQRFGPYVMGTFTAFIYHFNKSPKRISTNVNVSLWIISCLGLFFIVFGVPNGKLSVIATSFYVSFGHALWGLCLMWILLSCCWGIAHPINKLLSFKALMPLSRLTYCAYLIHPTIMMITSYNSETPFPLKHGMIVSLFMNFNLSFSIIKINFSFTKYDFIFRQQLFWEMLYFHSLEHLCYL
jgi:peptidoglycan/LPS O-acetylase OafA/YrhL